MRQKSVKIASKTRQKCVKNARNTFGGGHLLNDTDSCRFRGTRRTLTEPKWQNPVDRAHTKGVVQQRTLLRRVSETAFEKALRRVLRRCLAVGF